MGDSCGGEELTIGRRADTGTTMVRRRRSVGQLMWTGLRRQERQQQQLHTRLKSTCRRATSATMRRVEVGADMEIIMPREGEGPLTGDDLRSR